MTPTIPTPSRTPPATPVSGVPFDADNVPADSVENYANAVPAEPASNDSAASAASGAPIEPRATSVPAASNVPTGSRVPAAPAAPNAPIEPRATSALAAPNAPTGSRVPAVPTAPNAPIGSRVTSAPAASGAPTGSRVPAPTASRALIEPRAAYEPVDSAAASEQHTKIVNTTFAGTRTRAELCETPSAPLVCVIADPDETRISVPAHENLLVVDPGDWNDSLSPWPAPACFRGGGAFGGYADRFLQTLTESILPAAERELGLAPTRRALCGYSLAGLFALYALYRTDRFTHIASASGSLWYDDFLDFLRANAPRVPNARVRLSLGDREEFTKNPRLAAVGSATRETVQILRSQHLDVTLTMNPGNHFFEPDARLSRLIEALAL